MQVERRVNRETPFGCDDSPGGLETLVPENIEYCRAASVLAVYTQTFPCRSVCKVVDVSTGQESTLKRLPERLGI